MEGRGYKNGYDNYVAFYRETFCLCPFYMRLCAISAYVLNACLHLVGLPDFSNVFVFDSDGTEFFFIFQFEFYPDECSDHCLAHLCSSQKKNQ